MNQFFKILSVFITCSFAFKIGFPTAFMVFRQDFFIIILVSCSGGIAGNILFTHLSSALLRVVHNYKLKRGLLPKKKKISSFHRRVIRVKQKFGLAGIAFITPIFLSTPVGAFLARRFFKDKRKIIIYLSAATVLWAFLLYFILYFFHESLKGWLI